MTDQNQNQGNEQVVQQSLRSFTEELSVSGGQLLERLQELIQSGNIRRLIIKDSTNGRVLLEVPLTLGVVAGASMMFFVPPFLAAVGAIAALVAKVHIVVERYSDPADALKEKTTSVLEEMPRE